MPTRIDVCRMLGSLDSDPVGRFAEAIVLSSVDTKLRSPLQKAFTMVQDYLHDKDAPVLTVDQAKVFERLAPPSFGLRPIDQPAFTETLLVAVYSRATELLRGPGAYTALDDLDGLPTRVEAGLKSMEPGVLGEFVIETAIGVTRSSEVSQRLTVTAEAIQRRLPGLSGLEAKAKAIFRQKQGDDDCECVVVPATPTGTVRTSASAVGGRAS